MNLSLVEKVLAEQQEVLKAEMCSQAKAHTMPPVQVSRHSQECKPHEYGCGGADAVGA